MSIKSMFNQWFFLKLLKLLMLLSTKYQISITNVKIFQCRHIHSVKPFNGLNLIFVQSEDLLVWKHYLWNFLNNGWMEIFSYKLTIIYWGKVKTLATPWWLDRFSTCEIIATFIKLSSGRYTDYDFFFVDSFHINMFGNTWIVVKYQKTLHFTGYE